MSITLIKTQHSMKDIIIKIAWIVQELMCKYARRQKALVNYELRQLDTRLKDLVKSHNPLQRIEVSTHLMHYEIMTKAKKAGIKFEKANILEFKAMYYFVVVCKILKGSTAPLRITKQGYII